MIAAYVAPAEEGVSEAAIRDGLLPCNWRNRTEWKKAATNGYLIRCLQC